MTHNSQTSSGVMKTAFRELMKGVYTSVPGHVITLLDGGKNQRAQVQVGIQRIDINGAEFELPPIIDVPVLFPGDDYCLEYEITNGCEGAICFSQRCMDGWKNTGGIAQNPIGRFHDLQDAYFVPGLRSMPNVLPSFANNGIRLRNKSGTQYAWLKNDGSIDIDNGAGHIRIAASGVVTINGVTFSTDGLVSTDNDLVAGPITLRTHRNTGVEPGSGTSGGPV